MANIVVFHSVLGIRAGVTDLKKQLEDRGHRVYCIDLYDGRSFDDMEEAFGFFEEIGIQGLMERTVKYTEEVPKDAFYLGFSNGGASALLLAGTIPGSKGCILLHAALPIQALGIDKWPETVPVEVHYAKVDPWKEEEEIRAFEEDVKKSGASYEYYEYPVEGHLFTDPLLPEYHKESADLLVEKVLKFIEENA